MSETLHIDSSRVLPLCSRLPPFVSGQLPLARFRDFVKQISMTDSTASVAMSMLSN